MNLVRTTAAVTIPLILAATAWISPDGGTSSPGFAEALLALMAFGLVLTDNMSMGFLFVILTMDRLSWRDSLLMADSAILLLAMVRPGHVSPTTLVRSLASTSLAIVFAHAMFHAAALPAFYVPFNIYLAVTVCFGFMNAFRWKREILWTYPYYMVGGSLAVLFPTPAVQPAALVGAWLCFRMFESRLEENQAERQRTTSLHLRTIEALSLAIEARDKPLPHRSRRVPIYVTLMARELDIPEAECEALRVAALLYDVGELAVPEHIILKPGKLSVEEFDKVKIHPQVGAEMLESVSFPYPVAPLVRSHHEHWDGSGYPHGLKGDAIPRGARIIAVVDALDALASPRQYREAMPLHEAVEKIAEDSGRAYDPQLVELIRRNWRQWEVKVKEDKSGSFTDSIVAAQREAKILFGLAQKLGNSLDPADSFQAVKTALDVLVPYGGLAVWIEHEGCLRMDHCTGAPLEAWRSSRLKLGQGVSGQAAQSGQLVSNGEAAEDLEPAGGRPFRHAMAAPLVAAGVRGSLTLYLATGTFTQEHGRVLAVIGPKLAAAISNGLRYREVQDRAGADPLTGLPNASALSARMATLAGRCAVVVCDLDGFKRINDRHGHMTGNRVLERLAQGFRGSCREHDFVARMGGDEFVLLLGGVHRLEIGARLEGFREMVQSVGREIASAEKLDASFGVAFYPEDASTPEELLAKADASMYQVKAARKSGVVELRKGARPA